MLSWIGLLILGTFLGCCAIAVFASLRQIFKLTFNSFNTPKRTREITHPARA